MSTIYVLLVIFATGSSYGGVGIVQQEFSSLENCEAARQVVVKVDRKYTAEAIMYGCFKK